MANFTVKPLLSGHLRGQIPSFLTVLTLKEQSKKQSKAIAAELQFLALDYTMNA